MSALANTTNGIFTVPYKLTQSALLVSVPLSLKAIYLYSLSEHVCV